MEDMIEESESLELCPVCNAEGETLGQLGNVQHYRCRNCGMRYHVYIEITPEEFNKGELRTNDNR